MSSQLSTSSARFGATPNNAMELTVKSVTPFEFAKAAPLSSAADPRCYAA
jgi:hypothetical protein